MGAGAGGGRPGGTRGQHLFLTWLRDLPAGPAGEAEAEVNRLAVLAALAVVGIVALLLYRLYRSRWTPSPERLLVDDLGLELMAGCCAFVVFTTPACRPCKAALRVVEKAAGKAAGPTEVRTVDALERPELAVRYSVRTIPTVFLITASGHVVERWRDVPDPAEVEAALAAM